MGQISQMGQIGQMSHMVNSKMTSMTQIPFLLNGGKVTGRAGQTS